MQGPPHLLCFHPRDGLARCRVGPFALRDLPEEQPRRFAVKRHVDSVEARHRELQCFDSPSSLTAKRVDARSERCREGGREGESRSLDAE